MLKFDQEEFDKTERMILIAVLQSDAKKALAALQAMIKKFEADEEPISKESPIVVLEQYGLITEVLTLLEGSGCDTVGDFLQLTQKRLLAIPYLGRVTFLEEIKKKARKDIARFARRERNRKRRLDLA